MKRLTEELELIKKLEQTNLPVKEQFKIFLEKTGKCRASFFRYKKMIKTGKIPLIIHKKKFSQHQMLQIILEHLLRELGLNAWKEKLNIDVIVKKDNELFTIEIGNHSSHEIENLKKCLIINPKKHIHIILTPSIYRKLKNVIKKEKIKNAVLIKGFEWY